MSRVLLCLGVLVVGCKGGAATGAGAVAQGGPPETPEAPPAASPEDQAHSHVIEAYNALIAEVQRSVTGAYESAMGPTGPAPDALAQIRLAPLGSPFDRVLEEARDAVAKARRAGEAEPKNAPSSSQLVADAEAMVAATAALGEAYRAAARYYGAEAFKADPAKAGPLHQAVVAAATTYAAARERVAAALSAREQAVLARELAQYTPGSASYAFRKTLMDAKALVSVMAEPAAFAAANEAFQKTAASLGAVGNGKPLPPAFTAFARNVTENMAPRAAKLAGALADPAAPTYAVDADRQALGGFYNNLVQSADSLAQLESTGAL